MKTKRMHFLGLAAAKGGVGQSLLSYHWAKALGASGKRVLLLEATNGDLSLIPGVAPPAFADAVAAGRSSLSAAVCACSSGLDLLAAPEQWRFASDGFTHLHARILTAIENEGPWDTVVVDFGKTPCLRGQSLWERCDSVALVTTSDVAAVSRGYSLLREIVTLFPECAVGLAFNRLRTIETARECARKFELLTTRFLGRKFPVYGAVTEGETSTIETVVKRFATARTGVAGRQRPPVGKLAPSLTLNMTATLADNRE